MPGRARSAQSACAALFATAAGWELGLDWLRMVGRPAGARKWRTTTKETARAQRRRSALQRSRWTARWGHWWVRIWRRCVAWVSTCRVGRTGWCGSVVSPFCVHGTKGISGARDEGRKQQPSRTASLQRHRSAIRPDRALTSLSQRSVTQTQDWNPPRHHIFQINPSRATTERVICSKCNICKPPGAHRWREKISPASPVAAGRCEHASIHRISSVQHLFSRHVLL